jgi:hypothetical protein
MKIAGSASGSGSISQRHGSADPLVRGMDRRIHIRIWIHTKMSWIRNTGGQLHLFSICFGTVPEIHEKSVIDFFCHC